MIRFGITALLMSGLFGFEGDLQPTSEPLEAYVSSTLRRVEHFALVQGNRVHEESVLGLVEWREREVAGGTVLERDVWFADETLTIRHVERLTDETTRLVWREAGPGFGRSQIVEPEDEGLSVVDWLRSGVERSAVEARSDVQFPLALLEQLRRGERLPNSPRRYWPLTRSVEALSLSTRVVGGPPNAPRRLLELVREDGSLAGRFLFDGDALESFQWQDGGPWARRIQPHQHRRIRTRITGVAPVEAASSVR